MSSSEFHKTAQAPGNKTRLDSLMVRMNLAPSGNRARALIMSGRVSVNGKRIEKPGTSVREEERNLHS